MARFFINRPIVAMVFSVLTVIAGVVAISNLLIAELPDRNDIQWTATGAPSAPAQTPSP